MSHYGAQIRNCMAGNGTAANGKRGADGGQEWHKGGYCIGAWVLRCALNDPSLTFPTSLIAPLDDDASAEQRLAERQKAEAKLAELTREYREMLERAHACASASDGASSSADAPADCAIERDVRLVCERDGVPAKGYRIHLRADGLLERWYGSCAVDESRWRFTLSSYAGPTAIGFAQKLFDSVVRSKTKEGRTTKKKDGTRVNNAYRVLRDGEGFGDDAFRCNVSRASKRRKAAEATTIDQVDAEHAAWCNDDETGAEADEEEGEEDCEEDRVEDGDAADAAC